MYKQTTPSQILILRFPSASKENWAPLILFLQVSKKELWGLVAMCRCETRSLGEKGKREGASETSTKLWEVTYVWYLFRLRPPAGFCLVRTQSVSCALGLCLTKNSGNDPDACTAARYASCTFTPSPHWPHSRSLSLSLTHTHTPANMYRARPLESVESRSALDQNTSWVYHRIPPVKIYSNKEFSQLPEFLRNEQVVPDGFKKFVRKFWKT
jgi:hypothetical protein